MAKAWGTRLECEGRQLHPNLIPVAIRVCMGGVWRNGLGGGLEAHGERGSASVQGGRGEAP